MPLKMNLQWEGYENYEWVIYHEQEPENTVHSRIVFQELQTIELFEATK